MNKFKFRTFLIVIVVLAAMASVFKFLHPHRDPEVTAVQPVQATAISSPIDLGEATIDWRLGPSTTTSAVIFKKASDCFISVDRLSATYDSKAELARYSAVTPGGDRPAMTDFKIVPVSIRRGSTRTTVDIQEMKSTASGAAAAYTWQQVGFPAYKDAVFRINGYCADVSDVRSVENALGLISLSL